MKFIYDHRMMMHVKFHEDVIGEDKRILFDCLKINEFGTMNMAIHSDAHDFSLDKQDSLPNNFNEKLSHIFGGVYQNRYQICLFILPHASFLYLLALIVTRPCLLD